MSESPEKSSNATETQQPLARHRAGTEEEKKKKVGRFAGAFPLGYKEAVSQWWANIPAATAEHNVLSFVPYLKSAPTQTKTGATPGKPGKQSSTPPSSTAKATETDSNSDLASSKAKNADDPFGPREWHSELVTLSGKDRALNEFSVHRTGANERTPDQNLVMLHGYGAGLGFFFKNFEGLSRLPGWRVYALDLLGMGRSSRPTFSVKTKDRQQAVKEAEAFFVDALEEWRVKRGMEHFTLLGHSLGGYLAVAYALKYPGHINKLILASPVGIPEDPYAVEAEVPSESEAKAQVEGGMRSSTDVSTDAKVGGDFSDKNNFMNQKSKPAANGEKPRPYPKWLVYLWDANVSPFSLVRWSGPLGPRFVSGWTSRRFSHLGEEQRQALHTYAYTLFKQRGSGEYGLAYILAPGAYARSPLIRRIGNLGRQWIETNGTVSSNVAKKRERGYPVVFMYGDHDWMDVNGGHAAEKILNARKELALKDASAEEKRMERGAAKVKVIKDAGHHLYLEGDEEFNEFMRDEMNEQTAWDRQSKK